jgi:hypothetical protein
MNSINFLYAKKEKEEKRKKKKKGKEREEYITWRLNKIRRE